MSDDMTVSIFYINHRGETALRHIVPHNLWFGTTQWHPERQWLLDATDVERGVKRTFAMKDIQRWDPARARLEAEIAAAKPSHDAHTYVSTACLHGVHGKCRQTCKYCGDPCECAGCDHTQVDLSYSPTYDQLHDRVAEVEAERDLLGRQLQSIHALTARCEAERRQVTTGELYQLLITDPGDDERPWYSDVDIAVVNGVVQLMGDGNQLIANLAGDKAEILRDMLSDGIQERARQRELAQHRATLEPDRGGEQ